VSTERRNPRTVDIDLFPTERVLKVINAEDATVAAAVAAAIPDVSKLVDAGIEAIRSGGHVIYAGAGTSGRIAVVDAAEIPPTFGAAPEWIQAVIAGGTKAFTKAVEGSEDEYDRAAADLKARKLTKNDLVIGIAATGTTPYTRGALEYAKSKGAKTAAVVCGENTPMSTLADITVYVAVGPEVITGSTRMKAGTATKLVLNMITTGAMIRLGKTFGNLMVDLRATNRKLEDRSERILIEVCGIDRDKARALLDEADGRVKLAIVMHHLGVGREEAERKLDENGGVVRRVIRGDPPPV